MVFHLSWGYFAQQYHLKQIAVEKKSKTPKPRGLVALIKLSKNHNIKVIFVSPQFSQGADNVINIDFLAYDYENNLRNTAKVIFNSYK